MSANLDVPDDPIHECGCGMVWTDCYDCEDGLSHHDCGDDTCCCADDSPNVICEICDGDGGWWVCPDCHPKAARSAP